MHNKSAPVFVVAIMSVLVAVMVGGAYFRAFFQRATRIVAASKPPARKKQKCVRTAPSSAARGRTVSLRSVLQWVANYLRFRRILKSVRRRVGQCESSLYGREEGGDVHGGYEVGRM